MTPKWALSLVALLAGVSIAATVARHAVGVPGLRAEYFSSEQPQETPALTAPHDDVSLAAIEASWGSALPQIFSARWFGYLAVPEAGDYTFALTSDDGSRLWIDGHLVVDNRGRHAAITKTGTVHLENGSHPVL